MKIKLAKLLFLLTVSVSPFGLKVYSQDPTFTQFYSNPVYLNPALAGSSGCPRIGLNYRNEWPQLTGNYVTYCASFDTYARCQGPEYSAARLCRQL